MNFKNLLKKISKELTFDNLDKVLLKMEHSFASFQNAMDQFDKGLNDFTRELNFNLDAQDQNRSKRQKTNSKHLKKIWGDSNSSNDVKIWSDKKSHEKLF